MRASGKIDLWSRRTWKGPLRVAQERAARVDLADAVYQAELDRYDFDDGWTGYSSHPLAAWVSRWMDDDDSVVAPRPPSGVTYTFAWMA